MSWIVMLLLIHVIGGKPTEEEEDYPDYEHSIGTRADSREFSLENSREFLGKIEDRRFSRIFQNSWEFSRIFYSTVDPNFGKNSEKFKIFGISYFLRISDLMNSKPRRSVQNERRM